MTQTSFASAESSKTASLPTNLSTRPTDPRKVSTATFGDDQRASILIPVHNTINPEDRHQSCTAADEPISPLQAVSSITPPQTKGETVEPANPTSLHSVAGSCISPLPVEADGQPETPQTSTSLASYISETSTLGPLATQQDIKNDLTRMVERRQVQRKKLEKMLGNSVDADDDEAIGRGTAEQGTRAAEGLASDQENWIPFEHGPEICKSKLERFLGQGADSAHLVLNAEYRRRSPDLGNEPLREESSAGVTTSMLDTANRASSTSDVPGMLHIAETMGKLKRSGSLTNVLESGKKTLVRLNHGSSALRQQRSSSPDAHGDSEIRHPQVIRADASDWLLANNTELQERKILRNRTRKIGKVLGETLTENEVEEHVLGRCMARRSEDASELSLLQDCVEDNASRLPMLQEGDSQLKLSLRPGPIASGTLIKGLLLPSEDSVDDGLIGKYQRLSVPLSPTTDGIRRHSDPISPSQPSSIEEAYVGHIQPQGEERREAYTVAQAKKQRRLRLDKLNRLLGVHVPLALLGPAVFPKRDTPEPERPEKLLADDELDKTHAMEKQRAVKVANKMFNLFGEPPPNHACPLFVSWQDDSGEHSDDTTNRHRLRFRSSMSIYRQTIGSIRYLLEHDRRSLSRVMDELEFGSLPAEHLTDPFKSPSATSPDRYQSDRPKMQRKRSLSSPSQVSIPLASDPAKAVFADIDPAHCANSDFTTGLRKRAGKLNAFFGDPRVGSGYVGTRSKQYQITDRKAALERLLLDLEEDANFHAEQGDLKDVELEEIRSQLSDTRQVVGKELAADVETL